MWTRSRIYRILLTGAIAYAVLRLTIFVMLHTGTLPLPEGELVWQDLSLYLDASRRLLGREDLYPEIPRLYEYQYPPFFALVCAPVLWLPPTLVPIIGALAHLLTYMLLYSRWTKIFCCLGFSRGVEMLARLLPLWLVFEQFWSDLDLLNVYVLTSLLATFAIEAILGARLGWAALWLVVLLQIKPHWGFVVLVPLLLGHWRFFLKLAVLTIAGYAAISGVTMLFVGPVYGWEQYSQYVELLEKLLYQNSLWRTRDQGFLGYNHSIKQVTVFLAGATPAAMLLSTVIKVLLLVPLPGVEIFRRRRLGPHISRGNLLPALDVFFALYLLTFIWLDVVWEIFLGIVIFAYLLAIPLSKTIRIWICGSFGITALLDIWRLISFGVFGADIITPPNYVRSDPALYIPLTMIVIVSFYVLLLRRLWALPPCREDPPQSHTYADNLGDAADDGTAAAGKSLGLVVSARSPGGEVSRRPTTSSPQMSTPRNTGTSNTLTGLGERSWTR
ncbi:hypothetical protein BST45_13525 [Mycobacterium shinjukuense]|nr:hypothetical protein BST45_13525 [Mycobacterium shinjukuense]